MPEVIYNVDYDGQGPKAVQVNLDDIYLPFADKEFDVAFASHVLEHIVKWEESLAEWQRIADHVIVVIPNPMTIPYWVHPDHVNFFKGPDIDRIKLAYEDVQIFT